MSTNRIKLAYIFLFGNAKCYQKRDYLKIFFPLIEFYNIKYSKHFNMKSPLGGAVVSYHVEV